MRTWQITLRLPDNITQEQVQTEVEQLCEAGFDLVAGAYEVAVVEAPEAAAPAAEQAA